MKAISTKFYGATNHRGAKIVARDGDNNQASISWPNDRDTQDAHMMAAHALMDKMDWTGELVGGWVGRLGIDYAFCWLPRDMRTMTAADGSAEIRDIMRQSKKFANA